MTDDNALPLSIREVRPFPYAFHLTGTRPDGIPDGFHTGGAWLWEGEVYKPLDGRPYPNCEFHYPTLEDRVLEEMAGQPLFPRNWRIEERHGRRFLVRKQAVILGSKEYPYKSLGLARLLEVESGVRNLNRNGWEVNDLISIGFDGGTHEMFIVDMSAANKASAKTGLWAADDYFHLERLYETCGATRLLTLRKNARQVRHDNFEWMLEHREHRHVYASFNRPIDGLWARIPDAEYIHEAAPSWDAQRPHTWVLTPAPLDDEITRRYELTWGWSPLHDERGVPA